MSHRREQKERLRREREERERQARAAQQRKKMVGYGAGGLLVLAAVIVLAILATGGGGGGGDADAQAAEVFPDGGSIPEQKIFDVAPAAKAAGCTLKSVKAPSRSHTVSLKDRVKYTTNPPTSGRHYAIPAQDGIYGDPPQDEELVHAEEHGRVIIWAKPSLPEDVRANLRALVEDDSYQMFLVPRSSMPYPVAATAWDADPAQLGSGKLLLCKQVNDKTYDALAAFRDEHRSQGPEPVP